MSVAHPVAQSSAERLKVRSIYVAPWALPNETLPLHIVWEPNPAIDRIDIRVPSGFRLLRSFNATELKTTVSSEGVVISTTGVGMKGYLAFLAN